MPPYRHHARARRNYTDDEYSSDSGYSSDSSGDESETEYNSSRQRTGVKRGYERPLFPEYKKAFNNPPARARKLPPPTGCHPCARASNQQLREKYGLVGDKSTDIDHIFEKARAEQRGWNANIMVNLAMAGANPNRRWGALYNNGDYKTLEAEKRTYYGNDRYEEAIKGTIWCNKMFDYKKK